MPDKGLAPNKVYERSDGVRSGNDVFVQQDNADLNIEPDQLDAEANDMSGAISARWMRDGGNKPTANLTMGEHRFTDMTPGVDAADSVNMAQLSAVKVTADDAAGAITGLQVSLIANQVNTLANATNMLNKAGLVHSHEIGEVTDLSAQLAGKSPVVHGHVVGDVTGLPTILSDIADDIAANTADIAANGIDIAAIPSINVPGDFNIAQGYEALESNTSGSYNIGFGYQALYANLTGSNNIAIGHSAGSTMRDDYFEDVETVVDGETITSLQAITKDGSKKRSRFHQGVIAQEVKQVMVDLGVDFGGYQDHSIGGGNDILSIGYEEFIPPMMKAIQELSAKNDALVSRIEALEAN